MIDVVEENIKSIEKFKKLFKLYNEKKIDLAEFKPFRGAMGIYEQRTRGTYMLRIGLPAGIISLHQFKVVSKISKKYSGGKIHITSRQDIQFHDLAQDDLVKVMEEFLNVGITTMRTGGDTVRNVGCSPLSGVASDEIFDVTYYAKAVSEYLSKDISTMSLPRKYKIGFSNSYEDTGNATISDLGFIGKIKDGKKGFQVYGAGGLGGKSRVSVKLSDFIEAKDVLYYAEAMKEVFEKEGDRASRHKARIRFIVYRLGEEKFLKAFNDTLKKVKNELNLDLNINGKNIVGKLKDNTSEHENLHNNKLIYKNLEDKLEKDILIDENYKKQYKNILFTQKQKGYYSVYIHPQSGNISAYNLDKILNFLESLDYKISIRITNTQGFFIRDLKKHGVKDLLNIIKDFSSKHNIDNSLTCSGASICQLGLCFSQNLLKGIKEELRKESSEVQSSLPRIFISGCPNSCGQHQKGKIGFSGKVKKTDDGLVPCYSISFGGQVASNKATIGEVFGDIPAKKIPKYLCELAKLKISLDYDDFDKFLLERKEEIKNHLVKYSAVESFIENPDIYYDFGSSERFSIKKL